MDHTYILTDADRRLIAQAVSGFRQDFRYLEALLWGWRDHQTQSVIARRARAARTKKAAPHD